MQDSDPFCRVLIQEPDGLLVDPALDSARGRPAVASVAGPTFAPVEVAGRNLRGLPDRGAARDFVDVFARSRFRKTELIELAREVDTGFDVGGIPRESKSTAAVRRRGSRPR